MLFLYRGAAALKVCNSNTEEQQPIKFVILVERGISAGSVSFYYRGAAAHKVY